MAQIQYVLQGLIFSCNYIFSVFIKSSREWHAHYAWRHLTEFLTKSWYCICRGDRLTPTDNPVTCAKKVISKFDQNWTAFSPPGPVKYRQLTLPCFYSDNLHTMQHTASCKGEGKTELKIICLLKPEPAGTKWQALIKIICSLCTFLNRWRSQVKLACLFV